MFDHTNPYILRTEMIEDNTRYFVSFIDGEGVHRESEVSQPVYLEFLNFVKTERNLRRSDERHYDMSGIDCDTILRKMLHPPPSLEDTVFGSLMNYEIRQTIEDLPETQKRRFVLYHEYGLTYEQIADMEGCKRQPVTRSVEIAEDKIRKVVRKFI